MSKPETHQERYYAVWAAVGDVVLAVLTSDAANLIGKRLSLLASSAFIPSSGYGNVSALAFCLGMTQKGASDLARRQKMPFTKPGNERIFEIHTAAQAVKTDEVQT